MLKALVGHLLQVTGRSHLASFARGMLHLGRPSPVAFPPELVEQGAAIALSGLANTMAIQSNPDWVWPVWVVRQTDPDDPAFVPTGLNLITTNLTGRNWTSLGNPGSRHEAMVDPVGMVTPGAWKWSVLPCLRIGDRMLAPPLCRKEIGQELVPGAVPGVRTSMSAGAIQWTWDCIAAEVEGREGVLVRIRLQNRGTAEAVAHPGASLRPANPLSLGPIRSIRIENHKVRIDGEDALVFPEPPRRAVVSDRHNGDPLLRASAGLPLRRLRSRSGMSTCLVEWTVQLPPGGAWEMDLLVPLAPKDGFRSVGRRAMAHARERMESLHGRLSGLGTRLSIPESGLQAGWDAVRERMHVFDDGDRFTPGTFLYHEHWFRDAAFLALGFENLGWGDRVEPKMELLRTRQKRDGLFRSQTGEWDCNGQAIWTLATHLRRGGRVDLAGRHLESVLRGADWIVRQRRTTSGERAPHRGLLPAGFSAEHFGPNDHYFWDNFWSIAGLEDAAWLARLCGRAAVAERLSNEASEYRADLETAVSWAIERCDGGLPSSPYRRMDAACIGNLVAISPLGVCSPADSWVAPTLRHLSSACVREGLFFQSIVHTGWNPYLSVQLARARLACGDAEGALEIARRLAAIASPTWCWPEAVNPRTGGGCMGDGDHGWAAAEFLSLLRELVVTENAEGLLLLPGVPGEWLRSPGGVRLERATTRFGTVSLSAEDVVGGTRLDWDVVRVGPQQETGSVSVSLPGNDGKRRIWNLPSVSGRIVLGPDGATKTENLP